MPRLRGGLFRRLSRRRRSSFLPRFSSFLSDKSFLLVVLYCRLLPVFCFHDTLVKNESTQRMNKFLGFSYRYLNRLRIHSVPFVFFYESYGRASIYAALAHTNPVTV